MTPVESLDNKSEIKSAIYTGTIRHRRFVPRAHEFDYPIFMLYIDLDELPELFSRKWFCSLERFNIVSFRRTDYLNPDQPDLKQAVIDEVDKKQAEQGGTIAPIAHVRVLMHARYFNVVFNPVVFYYCFDKQQNLIAILAEITNTPWAERHAYLLPVNAPSQTMGYEAKGLDKHCFSFKKQFHVSPFNPMNMAYRWVFSEPSTSLHVHMENRLSSDNSLGLDVQLSEQLSKHFDATLVLERKPFEEYLSKTLIQYPLVTVKVVIGIYWQAFRLWLKRVPFYDNPKHGS